MKKADHALYEKFIESQLHHAMKTAKMMPPSLRYHPKVDDYTMSCGMARTKGGRVWLAWFAGGDNDKAVMVFAKSDDNFRTFSEPQFLLDPGYADCGVHISALVGNLWTAPDGRLFLFYTQSLGYFDGRAGNWYTVCENPDDEKPVWLEPVRMCDGAMLNKPTVLSDGTWLAPVSLWKRGSIGVEICDVGWCNLSNSTLLRELDSMRGVNIYASNDNGKTWQRRGFTKNENPTFDEPMIVERGDGSLLMYMRIPDGMTQSESFDGGKTWSKPEKTPFPATSARFFLTKLISGNLLLVRNANPDNPPERSFMSAFISEDGGKKWQGGLVLDERIKTSYPDGFQDADGMIHVQYDRNREGGEILHAAFTEEDVLAGKNVSGEAIFKRSLIQSNTAAGEKTDAQA